jgi:glycerol-3-phosphate O-acyltransferase
MLMSPINPAAAADRTAVVSKAALRAAKQLGLTNKVLAGVIGL